MSDGLPAGAISLESPEEGTTLVGAVTDPTVPVVDTAVGDDAEPEGTVVAQSGVKMVPLSALQAERGLRKESQKAVNELKPKADEYERVKGQVQAVMPLIQKVQGRPDVMRLLDQPPEPVKQPAGPLTDDEAVEHAKALDLYKADGTPDTGRAQNIAKMYAGISQRQTQQAIAPIVGNEAQRQSAQLYNHYAQMPLADGTVVDPKILADMWRNVPAEQSANQAVANVLYLTAIGEQMRQRGIPKPGPGPVVQTEGVGSGVRQPTAQITQLDTSIMRASGIDEKAYKQTAALFKPGQSNSLE